LKGKTGSTGSHEIEVGTRISSDSTSSTSFVSSTSQAPSASPSPFRPSAPPCPTDLLVRQNSSTPQIPSSSGYGFQLQIDTCAVFLRLMEGADASNYFLSYAYLSRTFNPLSLELYPFSNNLRWM
jgi:hypothetical protein